MSQYSNDANAVSFNVFIQTSATLFHNFRVQHFEVEYFIVVWLTESVAMSAAGIYLNLKNVTVVR